jgi:hypothetical protein
VSPQWETGYCIWAHQHSSWYSSLNKEKSAGLWRLPHFHKVHLKNSWERNNGEGYQSLSSLWRWCLFLYGLLVMPVICLVHDHIKFILYSSMCSAIVTPSKFNSISDVVPLKRWPQSGLPGILFSYLHHL